MKKKRFCLKYLNVLDPIKEEIEDEEIYDEKIYDEKMIDENINFVSNSEYKSEYESSENKDLNCFNYFCFWFCSYFNCFNM